MQQKQHSKRPLFASCSAAIWLLLVLAVATVASVPTSVLVQNSELASTQANNKNSDNKSNNNNNIMTKVKRSSSSAKDSMPATSGGTGFDKKSSPEIVPASFNAPPERNAPAAAQSSAGGVGNANAAAGYTLPSNGEIINSAIAAGLSAVAVEAAVAANQRDLEKQQQQLQQLYGNGIGSMDSEETPTLLRKRGISSQQQYSYGNGAGYGGAAYDGVGYGGAGYGGPGYGGAGYGGAGYGSAGGYGAGYGVGSASGYGNADYYNNPFLSLPSASVGGGSGVGLAGVPNGVWADEIDPAYAYTDLQDLEDYAPAQRAPYAGPASSASASTAYRSKAYDNLQNLLNSEAYLDPMVLPLTYPGSGRFYGAIDADRNKRSRPNLNKFADMRLKRDTQLTPADMLALVALVEAGERARKDTDSDAASMYPLDSGLNGAAAKSYNNYYPNSNANSYDYPTAVDTTIGDLDYNGGGAWLDPAMVDYYGVPANVETMPKYELPPRKHKYISGGGGNNRYAAAAKRFMVAKKKHSMGKFFNEPVANPSISYNNGAAYF